MREVEAKAHLSDDMLSKALSYYKNLYGEPLSVDKKDVYYRSENGSEFRIREENSRYFYTHKKKQMDENGFECNREEEKELTASQALELSSAYTAFFTKSKKGYLWDVEVSSKRGHIEVLNVPNLGWFLEIELLLGDDDGSDVIKEAREWIGSQFAFFNLEKSIEKRKYMEMLQNGR